VILVEGKHHGRRPESDRTGCSRIEHPEDSFSIAYLFLLQQILEQLKNVKTATETRPATLLGSTSVGLKK
jgi:hypothetical protein